jgi:hypothetical protein
MPRNNPCHTCAGGIDCEECINDPRNSTPVKLYTPKSAARALLAGKVLKSVQGWEFFWEDHGSDGIGFWFRDEDGCVFPVRDFSELYEEV